MSLVDRVNRGVSELRGRTPAESSRFGLDDLEEMFSFGGNMYPLGLQTSMGSIDEESIAGTSNSAFKSNGPIFALVLCFAVMLGQNYTALTGERIDWAALLATYVAIPLFLGFWFFFWIRRRSRPIRYEDMNFSPQADPPSGS